MADKLLLAAAIGFILFKLAAPKRAGLAVVPSLLPHEPVLAPRIDPRSPVPVGGLDPPPPGRLILPPPPIVPLEMPAQPFAAPVRELTPGSLITRAESRDY